MASQEEPTNPTSEKKDNILCINRSMLSCKLANLFKDASIACYWQFLSLFFVTSGLTVAQLGLINGIGMVFQLVLYPLWGAFFDSIKRRFLSFTFLCVVTTFLQFWSPWLVMLVNRYETVITYSDNTTFVLNSTVSIDHSKNYTLSKRLMNQHSLFVALAINNVIASIFMSGVAGYIEGAVVKRVFTSESKQSYGEQKLYGPIGYAVGSFITGVVVDHYAPVHLSKYTAAFYLYLPLSLFLIPIIYVLTNQIDWEHGKSINEEDQMPLVKDVMKVFTKFDNFIFLMAVFISGLTVTMYENYLYLFMMQKMNPSETLMAIATVVATISELLIYPFSAKIIKMAGCPIRCVVFGMVVFAFRLFALSYCTAPWQVLLNQLLRGPALSLPWAATVEHTWLIFPNHCTTTAMGIITSVYFTGSGIVTSILGGYLYTRWGGESLFRLMATISVSWAVFTLLYVELKRNYTRKKTANVTPAEIGVTNSVNARSDEETRHV